MSQHCVRIDSYFSLPTDLASGMKCWSEFTEGEGYFVELRSDGERISVSLQEPRGDDVKHVLVKGGGPGPLFDRVVGHVVQAMATHSDSVWVSHWSPHET